MTKRTVAAMPRSSDPPHIGRLFVRAATAPSAIATWKRATVFGESVVVVEQLVGFFRFFVALPLELPGLLFDLLLFLAVALLLLRVLGRRLLGDREPRGARGLGGSPP